MSRSNFTILLLLLFLVSSCNNASKSEGDETDAPKLFPIANNPDNPTLIFLKLTDKTEGDTSISYVAKGLYHQDTVGFIVEVDKNIPAGIKHDGSVDEENGFKKGWIKFKTSGAESDRFVAALAELWQVEDVDKMASQPIQPLVFSSNKTAVDLEKSATNSFKLFFNESATTPGELFFTFDTYKRSIELQEKEARFRRTIVHTFAE